VANSPTLRFAGTPTVLNRLGTQVQTRPTPTGWQHYIDVTLKQTPAFRFIDPLRALTDMEGGLALPVVEVIDRHANGSVTVRVSVFSETEQASPDEAATINGVAAELRFEDAQSSATHSHLTYRRGMALRTVNQRQLEVLRLIGDGDPDGLLYTDNYRALVGSRDAGENLVTNVRANFMLSKNCQ